jgi:type IX secretion system PorP/SprF family membrane protein
MKKVFYLVFFLPIANCLLPTVVFSQQDPQYSQYMFNHLAVNPAYAGNRDVFSTTVVYRDQWSLEGSPTTASLSLQAPLQQKKAGVGLEFVSDRLGLKRTNGVLASYAYRIQFLKGKLAFGLRTGFYNYVFEWDKVKVKDKADVVNTGVQSSKTTGTADFGMYYYTRSFYWGLGLTHLNRGKITDVSSTTKQSVHYFMPIGISFLKGKTLLNPSVMIKGTRAGLEIDLNMNMLLKERLWMGVSLRTHYGIVLMMQYLVSDKMKIGYSYDYGLNRIGALGKGTHEIMIGYDLNFKGAKMETLRYF